MTLLLLLLLFPDDNEVFEDLARTYANHHENMHENIKCPYFPSDNFPGGIINGVQWYPADGTLQDFNYMHSNCFEITVEMTCCKHPQEDKLKEEWEKNKKSFVQYLLKVHQGIKGHVTRDGRREGNAIVSIENKKKTIKTTKTGEYWRLLRPGEYRVKAESSDGWYCSGFKSASPHHIFLLLTNQ